jgi:putative ABC transport system permease protein
MLRSLIISAFRNLTGRKIPSLVNILSLSISVVASLFLGREILRQLHYDDFHEKGDRIYRVVGQLRHDGGAFDESRTGPPLAPLLAAEFAEVEQTVRLARWSGSVRVGEKAFQEAIWFTDPSFFDVFSFPLLTGNPAMALRDPFSIVLSETTARRYFGDDDPIGQVVTFVSSVDQEPRPFTVRGVLQDTPSNSHVKIRLLAPLSSLRNLPGWGERYFDRTWYWSPTFTYLLLSKALDAPASLDQHLTEIIRRGGQDTQRWKSLRLERLRDIHLYSAAGQTGGHAGGRWLVPAMAFFLAFVLLIACVNFTSMAMANATARAREIGLRKALGGGRRQITAQLLTESFLQSAIAVVLVVGVSAFVVEFLGDGDSGELFSLEFIGLALVVVGVTGTAAGLYPALFYAALRSPQALTGSVGLGAVSRLKKAFVILQFSGSAIALIATLVVHEQLETFRTADLGFQPVGIVSIETRFREPLRVDAFRSALTADPRVLGVTAASVEPGLDNSPMPLTTRLEGSEHDIYINTIYVGQQFAATMGIDLLEGDGRTMTDLPTDALLINRAAKERLGLDLAVGNQLELASKSGELRHTVVSGRIVAVTEGFHYRMVLSKSITQPLAMAVAPDRCRYLFVRARDDDMADLIRDMETSWSELFPGNEMAYRRLDWKIDSKYESIDRLVAAVGTGVITPILLIACIGLFGITAVSLAAMKKEIAIRKVLGASHFEVATLISREYVRLIGLSFLIAAPIVFLGVRFLGKAVLLQSIPQSPVAYAAGFVIVLAAALLTVNMLALRASRADPVDALRAE